MDRLVLIEPHFVFVSVSVSSSSVAESLSSVPQGLVLGPILFTAFYIPKQHHTHCMTLRQRGHNFELPKLKYQIARSSFINRSLFNYV